MDAVVFDGVEYVRAAVAAKKLNYTQDYIGQLCRGKKIDARLVGRTWFVNLASIEDHVSGRYKKRRDLSLGSVADLSEPKSDRVIPVSIEQHRVSMTAVSNQFTSNLPVQELRSLSVSYEPDDESLIPTIHKKVLPSPAVLAVNPAEARRVTVERRSIKATTYKATALPEIVLHGKLAVSDVALAEDAHKRVTNVPKVAENEALDEPEIIPIKDPKSPIIKVISGERETIDGSERVKEENHKVVIQKTQRVVISPNNSNDASTKQGLGNKRWTSNTAEQEKVGDNSQTAFRVDLQPLRTAQNAGRISLEVKAPAIASNNQEMEPTVSQSTIADKTLLRETTEAGSVVSTYQPIPIFIPVALVLIAAVSAVLVVSAGSVVSSSGQGYEAATIFEFENFLERLLG